MLLDEQLDAMLSGDFEKGWHISEQLERALPRDDPNYARHRFNRGWFLINRGRFSEGYATLDEGRAIGVYGDPHIGTKAPIWNPAYHLLFGKTVLLALEGGLGDEMLQVRFVKQLKALGATVVLMATRALHDLFSRVAGVEQIITREQVSSVTHDFWIPGFSAAWLTGTRFETLEGAAYLSPRAESVGAWSQIVSGKRLKVGIRWSGNPEYEHQQHRKFPPDFLLKLAQYDGAQIFSLQRDHDTLDLPASIVDLKDLLLGWEDTAGAIANMDLVISSCTSIAHLAAAMGKPTWVVVPILPYHCWVNGDRTTKWYDAARIFRQTQRGSWDAPFELLYREFEEKLKGTM